jgi:hypothetical protein
MSHFLEKGSQKNAHMSAQKGIDLRAELVQRVAFNYEDHETAWIWGNFSLKVFLLPIQVAHSGRTVYSTPQFYKVLAAKMGRGASLSIAICR